MSMKPGATVRPEASMRRVAGAPARFPIVAIRPSRMPTSAETAGVPSPSITDPPVMTRSYGVCAADWAQAESSSRRSVRIQIMIESLIPNP